MFGRLHMWFVTVAFGRTTVGLVTLLGIRLVRLLVTAVWIVFGTVIILIGARVLFNVWVSVGHDVEEMVMVRTMRW